MTSFANETGTAVLLDMLTHKRPAGSKTERRFIRQFIEPLGVQRDAYGNLYKRIGHAPVLWSCHTDTVHRDGGKQLPVVSDGIVSLAHGATSNCLGADCAAGVWLMREMILAGRPGLYVFHRAEELGGRGSMHIAAETPELLDGIRFAIALDRRDYGDVITHQGFGRCCSDDFAQSLAHELNTHPDLLYSPDDTGVFTDTANYTDLIGECTNLSVGYWKEHTKTEQLNVAHLVALREALCALDVTKLAYSREPGDVDFDGAAYGASPSPRRAWDTWLDDDQQPRQGQSTLRGLCRQFPDAVAEILEAYGITADEVEEEIYNAYGMIRRK